MEYNWLSNLYMKVIYIVDDQNILKKHQNQHINYKTNHVIENLIFILLWSFYQSTSTLNKSKARDNIHLNKSSKPL